MRARIDGIQDHLPDWTRASDWSVRHLDVVVALMQEFVHGPCWLPCSQDTSFPNPFNRGTRAYAAVGLY